MSNKRGSLQFGGSSFDSATHIISTSDGGYAVTGYYYESFSVGSYHLSKNKTANMFVIKLDANLQPIGAVGYGTETTGPFFIAETEDGGFIVSGSFSKTMEIIPDDPWDDEDDDQAIVLHTVGDMEADIFFLKLNSNLEPIKAVDFGNNTADSIHCMIPTNDGNFAVCGAFTGDMNLGEKTLTNTNLYDSFIIEINDNLEVLNAVAFGGQSYDFAHAIAQRANGNYIVGGSFWKDMSIGDYTLTNTSATTSGSENSDLYVIELNPDFTLNNATSFTVEVTDYSANSNTSIRSVAIADDGTLGIAADYNGTVVVGEKEIGSSGKADSLIILLGEDLEAINSTTINVTTSDVPYSIVPKGTTGDGEFVVCGEFNGTMVLDGQSIRSSNRDGYVVSTALKEVFTVTYTDGVDEEEVFADDVHEDITSGSDTPAFTGGDLEREGYVFNGWDPEVADTVTANATYTATWGEDKNGNNADDATEYLMITYTDGVDDKEIFPDKVFNDALAGLDTPEFGEDPTRVGYVFRTWDPELSEKVTTAQTYTAVWTMKDFTNIKDVEENDVTPETPLTNDPEPEVGDRFVDVNGDVYEIIDIGDTNPENGDTPITVMKLDMDYSDVRDTDDNQVTPKEPFSDDNRPEVGKRFQDENGDWYEITEVTMEPGESGGADPKTITKVKKVEKTYDDVKDEEGNPVTPKEPLGKDGEPQIGDQFEDENGDKYEITKIGEQKEDGSIPVTVKKIEEDEPGDEPGEPGDEPGEETPAKDYSDVKDEDGNTVTPKEPFSEDENEPEIGKIFVDENGDEYIITKIGDTDPTNGKTPITVGRLFTLVFDLNGGTLDGQTGVYIIKEIQNHTITIPQSKPTKEGAEFDYWEGSKHYPGDSYKVKEDHNFKAIWKETESTIPETKYSDVKDEEGNPVTPKTPLGEDGTTPKKGDKFKDVDGNEYEITSVGEPDPKTGIATVIVKKVSSDNDSGKKDSGSDKKDDKPTPKTGDESNMTFWIMLIAAACAGIGVANKKRRS